MRQRLGQKGPTSLAIYTRDPLYCAGADTALLGDRQPRAINLGFAFRLGGISRSTKLLEETCSRVAPNVGLGRH